MSDAGYLYRAVEAHHLDDILTNGITADRPSYWGRIEIAAYYAEDIEDNALDAVIIRVPLSALDPSLIEPDHPGIEEPLSHTLRTNDEAVWAAWEASDKTWQASYRLIGSIRYRGNLAPALLTVDR